MDINRDPLPSHCPYRPSMSQLHLTACQYHTSRIPGRHPVTVPVQEKWARYSLYRPTMLHMLTRCEPQNMISFNPNYISPLHPFLYMHADACADCYFYFSYFAILPALLSIHDKCINVRCYICLSCMHRTYNGNEPIKQYKYMRTELVTVQGDQFKHCRAL